MSVCSARSIAVANLGTTLQQTLASGARVLDLLDEEPQTEEVSDGFDLDSFDGASAHRVDFSYGGGARAERRRPAHPSPGSVVRVAGRSGSGKSTLLKLFMRFWDVDRGVVAGVGARRASRQPRRACAQTEGFMTQETHLFAGTVRDNLTRRQGRARPTPSSMAARAARRPSPSCVRSACPRGLDTPGRRARRRRFRAASASAWAWRASFCTTRRSCCSTSPTSNLDSPERGCRAARAVGEPRGQDRRPGEPPRECRRRGRRDVFGGIRKGFVGIAGVPWAKACASGIAVPKCAFCYK